ncbi:MAG: hypothetical protein ACOYJB_00235 [Christensenellaceae bacterium]|jgi:hypothetical protein
MGVEYYIFALFVFGLAVMLVFLILHGKKKRKNDGEKELEEKEKKIMMLYFEVEDMIDSFKEYVEAHMDKLDSDIRRVETDLNAVSLIRESISVSEKRLAENAADTADVGEQLSMGIRIEPADRLPGAAEGADQKKQAAIKMFEDGCGIDQIVRDTGLSKGEVAFMLKLNTNHLPH